MSYKCCTNTYFGFNDFDIKLNREDSTCKNKVFQQLHNLIMSKSTIFFILICFPLSSWEFPCLCSPPGGGGYPVDMGFPVSMLHPMAGWDYPPI